MLRHLAHHQDPTLGTWDIREDGRRVRVSVQHRSQSKLLEDRLFATDTPAVQTVLAIEAALINRGYVVDPVTPLMPPAQEARQLLRDTLERAKTRAALDLSFRSVLQEAWRDNAYAWIHPDTMSVKDVDDWMYVLHFAEFRFENKELRAYPLSVQTCELLVQGFSAPIPTPQRKVQK